jgi:S-DNA-T family DNA segregation ATPase FtsK/SpoIIIE
MRRIVRRNLGAFSGLAALALAAGVAASLATWAVDDPSLSHATDRAARNILGIPGAIVADLLTQSLGLAAALVLLPPVFWAWRAVFGAPSRVRGLTLATWVLGTLAAAMALAAIPPPPTWPLSTGLGGLAGDLARGRFLGLTGISSPWTAALAALLTAALALGLILHAAGLLLYRERVAAAQEDDHEEPEYEPEAEEDPAGRDADAEDDDDPRPSRLAVALGFIEHLALRLLARRRDAADRDRAIGRRVEPVLAGGFDADDLLDEPEEDDLREPEPERRPTKAKAKPARKRTVVRVPGGFELPALDLLAEPRPADRKAQLTAAQLEENAHLLENVLDDFGVRGEIINVRPGPVVALYELEPAPGIKSSRVIGLSDDIARSMSAVSCRVAVIPGKNAIGVELPNPKRETVSLRELLAAGDFEKSSARLPLALGKAIGGEPVIVDLARMPHLLVAGTTGSGKSVSINTMILSLLYRLTPQQCRMIMIDPKMLELSTYDGIPHLLTPVVTDPRQAVIALKWTVREMEDRYRKMSKLGVRNIDGYNARLAEALAKGEELTRTVQTGFDQDSGEPIYEKENLPLDPMPFIVVIIDEMADLMIVAGKDIEGAVQRLAQMARAAGIHVIMATQRPSVDVITGTIKANFPTRISFQVTSKIDSRTILNEQGAEQLLGQGDMLYMAGGGRIQRVHGPFVSDREVEDVVAHLKSQGAPEYLEAITVDQDGDGDEAMGGMGDEESGDLYDRAVAVVLRDRKASTSYIQRRLQIGYNRAASIIERMEKEGLVGQANHAGKRDILVGEGEDGR